MVVALPPPTQIHPNFRLIVHLSESIRSPARFYDRFEKYLITVLNVWEELLTSTRMPMQDRLALEQVCPLFALSWLMGEPVLHVPAHLTLCLNAPSPLRIRS